MKQIAERELGRLTQEIARFNSELAVLKERKNTNEVILG